VTYSSIYNKDGPNEQTLVWKQLQTDGIHIDQRIDQRFKTQSRMREECG